MLFTTQFIILVVALNCETLDRQYEANLIIHFSFFSIQTCLRPLPP